MQQSILLTENDVLINALVRNGPWQELVACSMMPVANLFRFHMKYFIHVLVPEKCEISL